MSGVEGQGRPGALVGADGERFEGTWYGPGRIATGELVFNTVMTGYQEVLTDPSYAGQVVAFTYPHLGNYGVNAADAEGRRPWAEALVCREISLRPSSWRSRGSLLDYLGRWGVGVLADVDTRRLTRYVRSRGSLPVALGPLEEGESALAVAAASAKGTDGLDLIGRVSTPEPFVVRGGHRFVVVYDFGVKASILDQLRPYATIEVVPAATPPAEVLERRPDGVLLSNGPGDPRALGWAVESVSALVGEVPIFGICLGHQVLGAAMGGSLYKLAFGHHGGNHPVASLRKGEGGPPVEVTSQNHNYALDEEGLASGSVSHRNLNDGVVEGLVYERERAFSLQYHPEAGPGPHDARRVFGRFADLMDASR